MGMEIEAKVKITHDDALRLIKQLKKEKCRFKQEFEHNTLYDTRQHTLTNKRQCLRMRHLEENSLRRDYTRNVLTFKGAPLQGTLKTREETETEFTDEQREVLLKIFKGLGYVESFYYQKQRSYTTYHDCTVCFDQIPFLGYFLEVEGPTEQSVNLALWRLGYKSDEGTKDGYPKLISKFIKEHPEIKLAGNGVAFDDEFPPKSR